MSQGCYRKEVVATSQRVCMQPKIKAAAFYFPPTLFLGQNILLVRGDNQDTSGARNSAKSSFSILRRTMSCSKMITSPGFLLQQVHICSALGNGMMGNQTREISD